MIFKESEIQSWERFYRANLINSLTGFKSVSLIGTADQIGKTNLGIFSNIVHIGSDPALVGYINRPLTAAPHTIANIESTGFYTINQIQTSFIEKAHQTSAKYPDGVSEFEEVGLNPQFQESFPAPFVKESIVKYGLTLQEILPIKLNNTFLVIGEIKWIIINDDLLSYDGFIDLQKAGSICSNGIDGYYTTESVGRFQYAKPGMIPIKILPDE